MFRFVADENFDNHIIRGLLRRNHEVDIVRVQDVGLANTRDEIILDWAAQENRILLTHDAKTMNPLANERVRAGEPMPGAFIVNDRSPIGDVIDELLLVIGATEESEWRDQVTFIPFR